MKFPLDLRLGLFVCCLILFANRQASAALMGSLSLEPNPQVTALGGETASFGVWLRDLTLDNPFDFVFSFSLNVAASDPVLTAGGADFSRFNFALDPGMTGILGSLVFDGDISDDGHVEYGADFLPPPFGAGETGILESTGDIQLGTLSVVAPNTLGFFDVAFQVDPSFPIAGGTFLVTNDAATLPGDGTLATTNSGVNVVAEPASFMVWFLLVGVVGAGWRLRNRPTIAA